MKNSRFTGGLLGLIGTSILCCLLCLVTLGIGTPWAVCMMVRWYIGHCEVDGKTLTFEGTGGSLFGNYIKWYLLSIITFGIYGLWMPIHIAKWVVERVHIQGNSLQDAPLD